MVSKSTLGIAVDPGFPDVRAMVQDPNFMGTLCATMNPAIALAPQVQPSLKI